jgi:biotin---protein ligase
MNVLVYSGPEVLQTSLRHTLSTLRPILVPHYTVQTISQESLASHPWSASCALLVFPSCRELSPSPFITIVRSYVEGGGAFLALSAGATYSSSRTLGLSSLSISGLPKGQTLCFYDKAASGYLYPIFHPGGEIVTSSVNLQMMSGEKLDRVQQSGLGEFVGVEGAKNIRVLARIGEKVAAVRCNSSKGTVVVCAPGIEFSLTADSDDPSGETRRLNIMREVLRDLGLRIPSEHPVKTSNPLPQFLAATPAKPDVVFRVMEALSGSMHPLEDKNDTFHFRNLSENNDLQIASPEPNSGFPLDPSYSQPKLIIVCRDGELPSAEQTPSFDLGEYFNHLSSSRMVSGLHKDVEPWAMGEVLFYGEVVTSTQTMLDKYILVTLRPFFLLIVCPGTQYLCLFCRLQFYLLPHSS